MTNRFSKISKRKNKKTKVNLLAESDEALALFLLRVPARDLIRNCTEVSPQWKRILSECSFWRDKMDHDGYHLEWRKYKLAGLSAKSFKTMSLKHCFGRNFINDKWNSDKRSLIFDLRWHGFHDGRSKPLTPKAKNVLIEMPPKFVDGEPEIPEGFERPPACIGIRNRSFTKFMLIKLADEGLTDEIMDNFRPTIVITEMVANRRDCATKYHLCCRLEADFFGKDAYHNHRDCAPIPNEHWHRYRREQKDENGRWIGMEMGLRFDQGEAEGWHH